MDNLWFLEIAVVFTLAIGLHWFLKTGLRLLYKSILFKKEPSVLGVEGAFSSTKRNSALELDKIFLTPARLLLWLVVITYLGVKLSQHLGPIRNEEYLLVGRNCGIIVGLTWMILRWKWQKEAKWIKKGIGQRGDPVMASTIGKLSTLVILLVSAIWILEITGLNILPLLAFGGIGAATLGFAAKDVIANFFGGLMLHITRPFNLGEEIIVEKEQIQGIVEQIGWCLTSIRDNEKRIIYLPNSLFSHLFVINCSRRSHRRIFDTFSIQDKHANDVAGLVKAIEHSFETSPLVDPQLPCLISLNHLREGGLEFSLEVYTTKTSLADYRKAKQGILLIIIEVLNQHKIQLVTSPFQVFRGESRN
jgi:MscS family membrane protein